MEIAEQFPDFLPADHGYYVQVQGEMAILGVERCDFVVYSSGGQDFG